MRKIIEDLAKIHSDKATFIEVNTIENRALAEKYKIKSVPTVIFINEGVIKDRFAGLLDVVDIESKLMNLLYDFNEEGLDFL